MAAGKMHAHEADIDAALVRRLLETQFPRWADLPLTPVPSAGTDNALYRLGDELVVRLPRIPSAAGQPAKEQRWLPRLAPQLPLAIPLPRALGEPGAGYPWQWSICGWLPGENATLDRLADQRQAALDLASFIAALQRIDATGGPAPGVHNAGRGVPLATRDAATRAASASLRHEFDPLALAAVWEAALAAPLWQGAPVWLHGDLQAGNLLAVGGRLSAVIDFGCLGVGDPACDVMAAWLVLGAETRRLFRDALQVDEATWARGRGWALSMGVIALPYYERSNPILAAIARRAIAEAVAEFGMGG